MKFFVTGASGWIGSPTVVELLGAGPEVVGLARSDASAEKVQAAGATPLRGDVDDPDGLAKAAGDSEGVIHLAFQHEVAFGGNFPAAAAADRRAVEAMGTALAGSDRPFVLAGGMVGLSIGRVATENDGLVASPQVRANPAGAGRHRSLHPLAPRHRRAFVGCALRTNGPRRRRPRVRGHLRRDRPQEWLLCLRRRRVQSVAGGPPFGCRAPYAACCRARSCRLGPTRGRR